MEEGPSSKITNCSTVDMDEWIVLLERKRSYHLSLRQTVRPFRSCLIGRVPPKTLELDRNAYEPINLSIGPYHHGNPALQVLEEKWRCLHYVLKLNPEKTLKDYLQLIEGLEQQARSCYSQDLVMETGEFIKMLLLDGCFLLVALHGIRTELPATGANELSFVSGNKHEFFEVARHRFGNELSEETASSTKDNYALDVERMKDNEGCNTSVQIGNWLISFLLHDLLLLENQIPFFVVNGIYELFSGERESSKIADRIGECLEHFVGYKIPLSGSCRPNRFHHLLHFWHMYFTPSQDREEPLEHSRRSTLFPLYLKQTYEKLSRRPDKSKTRQNVQSSGLIKGCPPVFRWRRAEQYHEAGVHFVKRAFSQHDPHSLLDIRFTSGLIEIPDFVIDQNTDSFFRNIIALEQTCPHYGNYFTSYCAFLSQIVAKPADVTLLAKTGILVHHMRSDEEVSALLTKLGKNVDFDINGSHYLKSVCIRMEEHYQSRTNRWMAWLWHKHFSNPWLSLAALAAGIVLLCTILQTVFTFLAYFNPAKA